MTGGATPASQAGPPMLTFAAARERGEPSQGGLPAVRGLQLRPAAAPGCGTCRAQAESGAVQHMPLPAYAASRNALACSGVAKPLRPSGCAYLDAEGGMKGLGPGRALTCRGLRRMAELGSLQALFLCWHIRDTASQ